MAERVVEPKWRVYANAWRLFFLRYRFELVLRPAHSVNQPITAHLISIVKSPV